MNFHIDTGILFFVYFLSSSFKKKYSFCRCFFSVFWIYYRSHCVYHVLIWNEKNQQNILHRNDIWKICKEFFLLLVKSCAHIHSNALINERTMKENDWFLFSNRHSIRSNSIIIINIKDRISFLHFNCRQMFAHFYFIDIQCIDNILVYSSIQLCASSKTSNEIYSLICFPDIQKAKMQQQPNKKNKKKKGKYVWNPKLIIFNINCQFDLNLSLFFSHSIYWFFFF